ncbi:MAG: hexosaminidase [Flavobacteriales bacterium]|jgi:hexosaminidase
MTCPKSIFLIFFFGLLISCETEVRNSNVTTLVAPTIIPEPNLCHSKNYFAKLNTEIAFNVHDDLLREADLLKDLLIQKGCSVYDGETKASQISFSLVDSLQKEAYVIDITDHHISIESSSSAGAFYAVQSLVQLLEKSIFTSDGVQMVAVHIEDTPRFKHRGMLFDCCRHFMSVDFVKRYLDLLASYKMNVLHWHLTEDQGWRVASDAYPKLTEIGAFRTELDGSTHGGFYSKADMKAVVAYAAERHITVIPEIEMPGHSSAAIAAYPWLSCTQEQIEVENEWGVFKDIYCAGNDSTIQFLETILDEVCEIFPSTYIHIGGDEAPKTRWESCSKCQHRIQTESLEDEHHLQSWFIQHFVNYLAVKGRKAVGWDEILEGGLPKGAVVQSWRGFEGGMEAARQGHEVIMSPTSHAYFDYPIKSIDVAKVYAFDPVPDSLTASETQMIIGGECNMWTEHAPQEKVDQKMFPRMLAMAEVLWTQPEQMNETKFFQKLVNEYPRLRAKGVDFGVEAIPVSVAPAKSDVEGKVAVTISKKIDDAEVVWRNEGTSEWNSLDSLPIIDGDVVLEVLTKRWGETYGDVLFVPLAAHKALWASIELPNGYSSYYTAGGNEALLDGMCGTGDFRDGRWQALQKEDLEAIISFDSSQTISSVSTQFYTYSNAWIFIPLEVKVLCETRDGEWEEVASMVNPLALNDQQQGVVPMSVSFDAVQTKRLKFIAVNRKLCPAWHDAPGEPAWLFCDEIIVR